MAIITKKGLKDFTDKIFGTEEELLKGANEPNQPTIKESLVVQGTLFSKDKWTVGTENSK